MKSILKQYHYLYKITNTINNKIYIGIHSTNNLNDGYFGSGQAIRLAIKKYNNNNFSKEILEWFDWRCEALQREAQIVNIEFINRCDTYNAICGGLGCLGLTHSEETKALLRINNTGSKHPGFGKPLTEDIKRKISIANTGRKFSEQIRSNMRLGNINRISKGSSKQCNIYGEVYASAVDAYKKFKELNTEYVSSYFTFREQLSHNKIIGCFQFNGNIPEIITKPVESRKIISDIKKQCSIYGEIFDSFKLGYIKFKELNPEYCDSYNSFCGSLRTNKIKDCFVLDINKV